MNHGTGEGMGDGGDDVSGEDGIELFDETREYTLIELCRVCRLPHERLVEYVAHGVVVREGRDDGRGGDPRGLGPDTRFSHGELRRLMRAVRVRRELEVELPNLALVVDLLDALERQRRELARLRRQLGDGRGH